MINKWKQKEIQKCKDDPVYFYENYFLIDGKKPPPLADYQKDILRLLASANKTGTQLVLRNMRGGKRLMMQILTADLDKLVNK